VCAPPFCLPVGRVTFPDGFFNFLLPEHSKLSLCTELFSTGLRASGGTEEPSFLLFSRPTLPFFFPCNSPSFPPPSNALTTKREETNPPFLFSLVGLLGFFPFLTFLGRSLVPVEGNVLSFFYFVCLLPPPSPSLPFFTLLRRDFLKFLTIL